MRGLLIFLLSFFFWPIYAQQAESLLFREKIHDFGELEDTGGNANYEFIFVNNAARPVKILSVQPSCGCTTPDWSKEPVASGKSGFIKVSFDPKGKPGYFNKTLTITTDLDANTIVLQIKGQVLASLKKTETSFTSFNGHLGLKSGSFNLGRVFINREPVPVIFEIYNNGDKPIQFLQTIAPFYLKAETPTVLQPREKGKIKLTFNADAKDQYGFVSDNLELVTDDDEMPRKSFSVYATVGEYFPVLSPEEMAKAPVLSLEYTSIDLGRTTGNNPLSTTLKLKNGGKKELEIHSIQPNCTCLNVQTKRLKLKPNEEIAIPVIFTSQGRRGTHQKAITIYSNDPGNPVQHIFLTAYIDD